MKWRNEIWKCMHQNVNTSELEELKLLEVTVSSPFLMYIVSGFTLGSYIQYINIE